VEFILAT